MKDSPMQKFIARVRQDEVGATAIEYGLIAAAIAVVIIAVLGTLGGKLQTTFSTISNGI